MPATPGRSGRVPAEGAQFPSQNMAANTSTIRRLRKLSQGQVAARMRGLGHEWSRQTLSDIERNMRSVNVDELFGLAAALNTSVSVLLDPIAFRLPGHATAFDIGYPEPISAVSASELFHDEATAELAWADPTVKVIFDDAGSPIGIETPGAEHDANSLDKTEVPS